MVEGRKGKETMTGTGVRFSGREQDTYIHTRQRDTYIHIYLHTYIQYDTYMLAELEGRRGPTFAIARFGVYEPVAWF